MFSAVAHKNLAGAEGYFDEHLSQNDYYAAGEVRPGQWIGAGGRAAGAEGPSYPRAISLRCAKTNIPKPAND